MCIPGANSISSSPQLVAELLGQASWAVKPNHYNDASAVDGKFDNVTDWDWYTYDDLYRLTAVNYITGPDESFGYDAVGNRTSKNGLANTYDAANQILTANVTQVFTHDNNGNVTGRDSDTFTWDHENRLLSASIGGATITSNYNGDGLRMGRGTPGGITTTVANTMLVASFGYGSAGTWTQPQGMQEAFDVASITPPSGSGISVQASFQIQGPAGATGTKTAIASNSGDVGNTHLLALKPASGSNIAFRSAASAGVDTGVTSLTINKPSGTAQNDVMIASIAVRPSSASITPPSGWTLVSREDQNTGTTNSLAVYRKVAGASEPADYTWTFSTSTGAAGGIQSFSGVDTSNPIDVHDGQQTSLTMAHSTPPGTSSTVSYIWDVAAGVPMLLQDGTRTFVYGPGGVLYWVGNSGSVRYRLTDGQGSTVAIADGDGTITDTYTCGAFGDLRSHSGSNTVEFTYTGEQTDPNGLEYLRARYYDPQIGRFLSADPLGGGYPYVGNNPANGLDPSGLYPICANPNDPTTCLDSTEVGLPPDPPVSCDVPANSCTFANGTVCPYIGSTGAICNPPSTVEQFGNACVFPGAVVLSCNGDPTSTSDMSNAHVFAAALTVVNTFVNLGVSEAQAQDAANTLVGVSICLESGGGESCNGTLAFQLATMGDLTGVSLGEALCRTALIEAVASVPIAGFLTTYGGPGGYFFTGLMGAFVVSEVSLNCYP
jgi:RHS repeat-associated protein